MELKYTVASEDKETVLCLAIAGASMKRFLY